MHACTCTQWPHLKEVYEVLTYIYHGRHNTERGGWFVFNIRYISRCSVFTIESPPSSLASLVRRECVGRFNIHCHCVCQYASTYIHVHVYNVSMARLKLLCSLSILRHEGPVWQVAWAHPKFGNILASCSYDRKVCQSLTICVCVCLSRVCVCVCALCLCVCVVYWLQRDI